MRQIDLGTADSPPGGTHAGDILFEGQSILGYDPKKMRELRREMQIIFQDPFSSLNPRKSVAHIVGEPLFVHGMTNRREREARVLELLEVVGLKREHMRRYPHQFSGGQRQRIGVARPGSQSKLIICDELSRPLTSPFEARSLISFRICRRSSATTFHLHD